MKCALRGLLRSLADNRKAATAIEYGLIAALIVIAMIASLIQRRLDHHGHVG